MISRKPVTIIHKKTVHRRPLGGQQVRDIPKLIREDCVVSPDAQAYRNGVPASYDDYVADGDTIEFLQGNEGYDIVLERIATGIESIAKHLDPTPPEKVGTPYVAERIGVSVKRIGDLCRRGDIPKSCIVPGTGNGKEWRFYRDKIAKWIEQR